MNLGGEFVLRNKESLQSKQRNHQYLKHVLLINGLVYYLAYVHEKIQSDENYLRKENSTI